jgi:hypothetical protein
MHISLLRNTKPFDEKIFSMSLFRLSSSNLQVINLLKNIKLTFNSIQLSYIAIYYINSFDCEIISLYNRHRHCCATDMILLNGEIRIPKESPKRQN